MRLRFGLLLLPVGWGLMASCSLDATGDDLGTGGATTTAGPTTSGSPTSGATTNVSNSVSAAATTVSASSSDASSTSTTAASSSTGGETCDECTMAMCQQEVAACDPQLCTECSDCIQTSTACSGCAIATFNDSKSKDLACCAKNNCPSCASHFIGLVLNCN
jgi:hypothetical protein